MAGSLYLYILFIGRGLIEVEYTLTERMRERERHVQTLKTIGSFLFYFSFPFFFHSEEIFFFLLIRLCESERNLVYIFMPLE